MTPSKDRLTLFLERLQEAAYRCRDAQLYENNPAHASPPHVIIILNRATVRLIIMHSAHFLSVGTVANSTDLLKDFFRMADGPLSIWQMKESSHEPAAFIFAGTSHLAWQLDSSKAIRIS